ncbi:MAG: hypothetical protein AVDCRST_MAG74-326 [uncultured Pyrinomonadaceae bacterium]|uniref:Uncharacterized protein n=1 Tax=uncultured Pyrinomonadaceae bacterium TaxID=2283094 RepID=A0A6J4N5K1_9BACT|nr:MAG: hypothetical protein AVDCRST_MAG74-326 [uncultured Pyrinomonadaceae bacterium]
MDFIKFSVSASAGKNSGMLDSRASYEKRLTASSRQNCRLAETRRKDL